MESSSELSVWFEIIHCSVSTDESGNKQILERPIGFFSTWPRAYMAGQSMGWRHITVARYVPFTKKGSGEGFIVIPHHVLVFEPGGRRYGRSISIREEIIKLIH